MARELYFDSSTEISGGSLFRITEPDGRTSFQYSHSSWDDDPEKINVQETNYPDFASFWAWLTSDPIWFYGHPLFVHPEQREFVRAQLKAANWNFNPNKKWQESHQRQWRKVLSDPGNYYQGPSGPRQK